MASRYWVGGSGSWDGATTTHWSATSGGGGGSSVPTSADNVFFDANSTGTVTTTANPSTCANWDCTGFTGTFAGTTPHQVYGDLTLASAMTYTHSGLLDLRGTGSHNINTSGKTVTSNLRFLGSGGTYTLQDHYVGSGYFSMQTTFTLNANNYNITAEYFAGAGTAPTINMGSGTWTGTGTPSTAFFGFTSGATVNADTSTLKFTGAVSTDKNFNNTFNETYYNVWFATTGAGVITIRGTNTFNDLKIDAGRTVKFTDGTTQTVTTLTCAAGTQRTLTGTSTAGWTISDTTGTNTVSNCTISYSTASGGATFDASGATNVNGGNNSGWLFPSLSSGNFLAVF